MSTALSTAYYARLAGTEDLTAYPTGAAAQAALAALLAIEQDGRAAITRGNESKSVVYPNIIIRTTGGTDSLAGHDFGRRAAVVTDLEIWESRGLEETITDIDAQVEKLLDMRFQAVPVFTLSSGKCYWLEALTELSVAYDSANNAWFGLRRYMAVEGRV